MKRGVNGGGDDREWAEALWDWCGELAGPNRYGIQVGLSPTSRRGVFTVRVRAVYVVDGRATGIVAQVSGEYPNADRVKLLPYINRLQMALGEELVRVEAAYAAIT